MSTHYIITVMIVALMTGFMFGFLPPMRKANAILTALSTNEPKHPYREAAVVESYETNQEDYCCPVTPKKKRDPIVLPKSVAVFMLLVPAMITDIGLGFAYDTNAIGTGAKWGCFAAGVLTNIFFIVCAIARSEQKN